MPFCHSEPQWLTELEKKWRDNGTAKIFDSELYSAYRLPLGLDLSKEYFPLQSASSARNWDAPGITKGEGRAVFDGMTIALAIEEKENLVDW